MIRDQAVAQLGRLKDHDLLWLFRANLVKAGLGRWNDMPKCLRAHIQSRVLALLHDVVWVDGHVSLAYAYERTWSQNAIARTLVMHAGFQAIAEAAASLQKMS